MKNTTALAALLILSVCLPASAQCSLPTITGSCSGLPCVTGDTNGQGATVTWTTNVAADSGVGWGGANVGTLGAIADSAGVTSHSYHVTGLLPGKTVFFGIRSRAINAGAVCPIADWAADDGGDVQNASLSVTLPAAPAGSFDYALSFNTTSAGSLTGGPQNIAHVTQGFGTYLTVVAAPLVSSYSVQHGLKYVLTGLPSNISITWSDANFGYPDTVSTTTVTNDTLSPFDWNGGATGNKGFYILTNQGGTTPTGTYTITLTSSANNGSGYPTHSVTETLVVDSASSPFGIPTSTFNIAPSSYPAIPNQATYISSASIYIPFFCPQDLFSTKGVRANGFLTTSSTAVASAGSHAVTLVGDVSQYAGNTGLGIVINFPMPGNDTPADTETIATGNWSIVGQVLTATFAATHTAGFSVQLSNFTPVATTNQQGMWYYDGVVVTQNIARLTGVALRTYQQCIDNVNSVYRDNYAILNSGNIQGFLRFTRGPYYDYLNTRTPAIVTLFNDFDIHKTTNESNGGTVGTVNFLQRETAYFFEQEYLTQKLGLSNTFLGQPTSYYVNYYLDQTLLHIDQICLSRMTDYFEFFMVGLQAKALIHYYEDGNHDVRIPSAIKCLADYIYPALDSTFNAFPYDAWSWAKANAIGQSHGATGADGTQELANLLIAPMYAWLFKMTGQAIYQTEGDTIWSQGVTMSNEGGPASIFDSGSGNSGKTFSQQYAWGPDYITWRSVPAVPTVTPILP